MDEGEVVGGMAGMAAPPSEEEGAGILHFLLLLAVIGAGLWFWSNSSGQQSSAGAATVQKPDPEELRRKRLEALQASMSSQPPAAAAAPSEAPASAAEKPTKEAAAAPRKETVEKTPAETVEVAKPVVEAKSATEEGLRKRAAPEKAPVPPPTPAKEVPPAAKENTPPPAVPQRFACRARGTLQGASVLRSISGVEGSTSVQQLRDMLHKAFLPEAKGHSIRIFFSGKELKDPEESARQLGLSETSILQVMFAPLPKAAEAAADSAAGAVAPPEAQPLTVRLQSTVKGSTCAHVIEELTTASRVLDLEGLSMGAFEPGDGLRPRLFFMGRELKEAETYLGHVGLKTKSTATVQVMFVAGEPRAEAKVPRAQQPPAAEAPAASQAEPAASAAAGGPSALPQTSSVSPSALATAAGAAQAETGDAVMAAAEAAGCNVSALLGGGGAEPGVEEISPAEAWHAMAALEEQLARETDFSEDVSVRQASTLLRQMLTTAAHESNPALITMAQAMVPDLKKIWGFEPTRDHLKGLLAMKAGSGSSS